MDKLYSVHRHFNQACSVAGIRTELLVNEDNLKVILSPKSISKIIPSTRSAAIANDIVFESKTLPSGTIAIISSDKNLNISSVVDEIKSKLGGFYCKLNESFSERDPDGPFDPIKPANTDICPHCEEGRPCACDEYEEDEERSEREKRDKEEEIDREMGEKRGNSPSFSRARDKDEDDAYVKWTVQQDNERKAELDKRFPRTIRPKPQAPTPTSFLGMAPRPRPRTDTQPRESRQMNIKKSLQEALNGIAVPDGAAQPKVGVEMLNLALSAKTKSGMSLKDSLKKQGIKWHAEPDSHVVVFTKDGDEKWRVEPMTLSDKKVFEQTMESLWSIALGKAPNAKELERDAASQRAQELRDHQKEITGLVDQITGKYAPPEEKEV